MIPAEKLPYIISNILLISIGLIYAVSLALSCSHTFQLMKNTCLMFDNMERSNDTPEKYYPYFIGRSCASTILFIKQMCLLVPVLVAMSLFKKIVDLDYSSYWDLFYLIDSTFQVCIIFISYIIYIMIIKHVADFNYWLKNQQGESFWSTIVSTIVKKTI